MLVCYTAIFSYTVSSDIAKETASLTTRDSVCHHHNGIYCPECKKTVCMCTVKDHFLGEAEDDSAYKSKAKVSVKLADVLAPFVIFNVILLQLLLRYNHLTSLAYVNALQSTDLLYVDLYWSGYDEEIKNTAIMKANSSMIANILITLIVIDEKVINHCQKNYTSNIKEPHVVTSSSFSDDEMQNDDQPSKNTNLVAFCVALILFFTILLSAVHNDYDLQPDHSLQDAKYKHFCKHGKLLYLSKCLANSKSLSEKMLFVTNTEIQGCVDIQAIGMLENSLSHKVCCRNSFEEIANQIVEVTGGINLLCNKFQHNNLLSVLFLRVTSCSWKERHAKNYVCKQESEAGDFSILKSILSNLQLFVNRTVLSSQINFIWDGSSQKLFNVKESIKESDNIFTKKCKNLLFENQLEYLLPQPNVVIQSSSQGIPWMIPEATSGDNLFIAKCPFVTLNLLPEFTLINGDINTGFTHTKNLNIKSVGHFVEKDKTFSGVSCQQSKLCNTLLYSDDGVLQLKGLCTHLVKPNVNANVFVIEMANDEKDSVYYDIPLLMIDLGRCSNLIPEITASSLLNDALVEIKKFYSHLIDSTFYMSCLESYAIGTTKAKRNRLFQGAHTKLVTTISETVALLQSLVIGLTLTVRCHSLSDTVHAVFRPLGKPNVNQQSVSKSMNQQQSFASHSDCRDTGGSVRSTSEHTEGRQEDMLQSSVATESNDQPLQIKPEGYHMSVSNDDTDLQEDTVEKDSPLPKDINVGMSSASASKQNVVKKEGKSLTTSGNDPTPVGKDHVGTDSLASNQQSFTNPTSHGKLPSQGNCRDVGNSPNNYNKGKQLDIQSNTQRDRPLDIQPESYHMPAASNTNVHSSRKEKNVVERDGHSPLHNKKNQKIVAENVVEKDGKLSMPSGADQATPLSSITEHKLMIGNVTPKSLHSVDHSSVGAQFVKGSPRETKVLPTPGDHLDASYKTNFEHEVQSSREEIRHKGNARTTFYQHEVEQHAYNPMKIGELNSTTTNPPINDRLQVKPPEVKVETGKGANDFKPKPLPKRSCIVCGNKQYPLGNNLVSLPHMDHYFVKERKEIRPSHYLAKLVLRHQYQNRYKYSYMYYIM